MMLNDTGRILRVLIEIRDLLAKIEARLPAD